mmetsp:Transcript_21826/g.28273  ORF Transcript_21826/g.28273 Transcript_21826/m.28273 type:complete len:108 (+) Transcript_21826:210-533(+)|eukprot:CAMPEP_0197286244 /NCGR_PEP_ID=MMETSP0890-20130614/1707_1 /TAXON_ID=44058 ORGANISM="Aureoumbra lagunensis, Strain CCMP1510" /NCGR_SAMPLE_ID=MMETSP0890 /ASSEMBLY_ACC=CAM_ASM_000533 /LENGTH=107 /DNA_ID=CAMNT_0042754463 /DNA_START=393 /DNA_END=716 /DNA_ORIENTATION=+
MTSIEPRRWGPIDILSARENRSVVFKLMRHMFAVAIGPIGTFILVRDLQSVHKKNRDAIAATAAVLVLNFLIALYIIMAFNEPEDPQSGNRRVIVKRLGRWAEPRSD